MKSLSIISFLLILQNIQGQVTLSNFSKEDFSSKEQRYLIYNVNFGEGFNLRRDVYMRIANTVRHLQYPYILVLPPWGNLFHWRNERHMKNRIKWEEFFDIKSLSKFVPVMEFEDFLKFNGNTIDSVVYLQAYKEGWSEKEGFVLKYDVRPCLEAQNYYTQEGTKWKGSFFSYEKDFESTDLKCLSIQGESQTLTEAILNLFADNLTILVDRAETILHDKYADSIYWRARFSMHYAKKLRNIGDQFRLKNFNSSDSVDKTIFPETFSPRKRTAKGGEYLCVHWRRADFLRAHKEHLPSVKSTANQIIEIAKKLNLKNLFLSTDGDLEEIEALKHLLDIEKISLKRFIKSDAKLLDGAVSIIDQYICSHARYFIGTHLSTFSFRIQEDREILGFLVDTTFNRLCPDTNKDCEQPAKWTIVYD